jgi:peptidoglycan/xylan/chitin deacetylase (PgdA/CDA1 family)
MTRAERTPLARRAGRMAVGVIGSRAERVLPAWRAALTRGLTVFVFHDVTASPSAFQRAGNSYTSPECFEHQIAWIAERFTLVVPSRLRLLGGSGGLPSNAAMITFDDAWAGVFRTAIPILRARDIPALCFLNMGTIAGDPDLAAVRRYERARAPEEKPTLAGHLDLAAGARAVAEVADRYGSDPAFREYEGTIATEGDLAQVAHGGDVWFGSHLYHHWDLATISDDLYEDSLRRNLDALARYANSLPAFATPYGSADDHRADAFALPLRTGARMVFTGTGNQNRDPDSAILDRVWFTPEPTTRKDWWYATHRRRIIGSYAS